MRVNVRIFDGVQVIRTPGAEGRALLRNIIFQFSNLKRRVEFVEKKIVPNREVMNFFLNNGVDIKRKVPKPPTVEELISGLLPSIGFSSRAQEEKPPLPPVAELLVLWF